jgi:hypothetical protein
MIDRPNDRGTIGVGAIVAELEGMGHRLRWYIPNVVYEFSTRTIQERFLLRPSPFVKDRILGVIGRAQALYDVRLHNFAFLSNHDHQQLSAEDGEQITLFRGYVNSNVARIVGPENGWRGTFWSPSSHGQPILDDVAMVERFRYILSQGVKEGLVRSPLEWPGANAAPALVGDMTLRGTWIDRTGFHAARRKGPADIAEFTSHPTVTLTPLPCWRDLSPEQLRERHQELVDEVIAEHRERRFLGPLKVQLQNPLSRPDRSAKSSAPLCHTVSESIRLRYRALYRAFCAAFRSAATQVRTMVGMNLRTVDLTFPPGSFPRPRVFIPAGPTQLEDVYHAPRSTGPPNLWFDR